MRSRASETKGETNKGLMKDWRMEGWGRRERRRGEIISTGMIRHWDIPLVFGMKESHSSTYQYKHGVDYYCVCLAWTLVNNGSLYYSAVAGSINYNYNADNVHASFITGSWINFTVLFSLTRACKVTRVPHGGWLLVKRSFLRSGTRMCKARWIKSPATASDIDSQARLHITAAVNFLSLQCHHFITHRKTIVSARSIVREFILENSELFSIKLFFLFSSPPPSFQDTWIHVYCDRCSSSHFPLHWIVPFIN